MFIDADDMLLKDAFTILRSCIDEQYDGVFAGFYIQNSCNNLNNLDQVYDSKELIRIFFNYYNKKSIVPITSSCAKLYKSSVVKTKGVCFNIDFKWHEDGIFNLEFFENSHLIFFINKPIYFYRENPNSVSKTLNLNYIDCLRKLIDYLDNKEFKDEKLLFFVYTYIVIISYHFNLSIIFRCDKSFKKKYLNLLKEVGMNARCKLIKNNKLFRTEFDRVLVQIFIVLWSFSMYKTTWLLLEVRHLFKQTKFYKNFIKNNP